MGQEKKNFWADNHTNDETRVPRKPRKKETKIFDIIFPFLTHF